MKTSEANDPRLGILKTGTIVSDSSSWLDSLLTQIRELREERKHPRPPIAITAERDPKALETLIEMPSPVLTLFSDLREAINDILHPRKIETTVAPVEVEEIWSKPKTGGPKLVSVGVHVLVVVLALVPWAASVPKTRPVTETAVMVYTPLNLILPLTLKDDSGGGGGGGRKTLTPPSLGRLPKAADKQFVPPDPEPPKNLDPTLIVEPTVIAPQLAQLPTINLLNIGDPNGVPGPPSAGPGIGGGIGTGVGRGIGEGKGPGVGPGEGGGTGGGVFRVGGGVTPPTILQRVEPQYSEEARKARYQGTVVLEAVVRRDGTVDILRVVRSLGFGLDENAMQALRQWRFKPGMKNGVAVDVSLNIEVNFNLR
ncbi:MAG: energy transducer TonB [Acidobacteria bacterium]|nr:energy transducer TonB [Acidobacteriota bacterium]